MVYVLVFGIVGSVLVQTGIELVSADREMSLYHYMPDRSFSFYLYIAGFLFKIMNVKSILRVYHRNDSCNNSSHSCSINLSWC